MVVGKQELPRRVPREKCLFGNSRVIPKPDIPVQGQPTRSTAQHDYETHDVQTISVQVSPPRYIPLSIHRMWSVIHLPFPGESAVGKSRYELSCLGNRLGNL